MVVRSKYDSLKVFTDSEPWQAIVRCILLVATVRKIENKWRRDVK